MSSRCSAGQRALETDKAGNGHGVFFHHVIEGLNGKAADPETGEVSWDDLVSYLRKNVNKKAREWDPENAARVDASPRTRGRLQDPHVVSNLIATPTPGAGRHRPPPARESPRADAQAIDRRRSDHLPLHGHEAPPDPRRHVHDGLSGR